MGKRTHQNERVNLRIVIKWKRFEFLSSNLSKHLKTELKVVLYERTVENKSLSYSQTYSRNYEAIGESVGAPVVLIKRNSCIMLLSGHKKEN